jgi:hypothetical protein
MRISQVGEPRVCLSFDLACAEAPEGTGFVAVNLPVKVEDRADEDGPMTARLYSSEGEPLAGKAIEKKLSDGWLVFRIPRRLCPEGGSLNFCALVDEVVLFQRTYRVEWRGRYPGLKPAV